MVVLSTPASAETPVMRGDAMTPGSFELLSPDAVIKSVEAAFGLTLDGTLVPYPSYINRVYGLRSDDGRELVAKFYRPDRKSVV
jgi:hypothetical protein